MKVSPDIEKIVDTAIEGSAPSHNELLRICGLDPWSVDAFYVFWGARQMMRQACDGIGEVHAQIGIDANPCPMDCLFCSFASCNTSRTGSMEMPVDKIIDYAKQYVDQGANCLTIMITVNYDFDQFIDYLSQLRSAIGPEMPITANMGDFSYEQALRLKEAGVGSVYHAVRMGEGVINKIPLDRRFETIQNAHEAGLKVLTCLEMIAPRYSDEEVITNLERLAALHPECASAGGMVRVPGTQMVDEPQYPIQKRMLYGAAMRFACGLDTRFGGGSLSWAEVGTNPRDDSNNTEKDGLGRGVDKVREQLEMSGFQTFRGPSSWW